MVHSVDGDTEFFDLVAGGLRRDSLAPYFYIISSNYVLQTSINLIKEKWFHIKKKVNADKI